MKVLACAKASIQQFKEGQKLLAIALVGDLADDFACERIERGVQGRSAVSLLIMSAPVNVARVQR